MSLKAALRRTVTESRARRETNRALAQRRPGFIAAMRADLPITLKYRGENAVVRDKWDLAVQGVRLAWCSDAFLAQALYRGRVSMRRRGIPVLPTVAHRLSMALSDVCIGEPVVMAPGVYIPHGQVVLDGFTKVGTDVIIAPWTTVGLLAGNFDGPTIGDGVMVGTGSRLLGPVTIGDGATLGANSVVVRDVPAGATVVGAGRQLNS